MRDLYEAQDFCKSQNEAQFNLPKMHGRKGNSRTNFYDVII